MRSAIGPVYRGASFWGADAPNWGGHHRSFKNISPSPRWLRHCLTSMRMHNWIVFNRYKERLRISLWNLIWNKMLFIIYNLTTRCQERHIWKCGFVGWGPQVSSRDTSDLELLSRVADASDPDHTELIYSWRVTLRVTWQVTHLVTWRVTLRVAWSWTHWIA